MRQTELAVIGETRKPSLADRDLITRCPDSHQAVLLQIQLSGLTDEYVCDALGMDKGHFSRCRTGTAHFPTRKLGELQDLTGNTALAQFLAHRAGFDLRKVDALKDEVRRLRERLEALEGAA